MAGPSSQDPSVHPRGQPAGPCASAGMDLARERPMHIDSDRSQFNPAPDGKPLSESTLNSALMSFSVGSPDALRKLEEGGFWLEAYRSGVKGDPMRAFQVVDRIDVLMQPYRLEATREYLGSGGRQQTYRERRIWHAVVHFAHELAAGYETCLQMF